MEKIGETTAIARFINSPDQKRKASVTEIKAFLDSCTPEQKREYAKQAAEALGCELT